jgi:hypothetical protein
MTAVIDTQYATAYVDRLYSGSYQVRPSHHYSLRNDPDAGVQYGIVRKGSKYEPDEMTSKWYADIRNYNGDIVRFAGIWDTRLEAVEEVIMIVTDHGRF